MSYSVIEFDFEEIGIDLNGVYCGLFSGSAGIDSDGSVCEITCSGWDRVGKQSYVTLPVPNRYGPRPTWNGTFALVLADEIEAKHKDSIAEKLDDWAESLSIREAAE